MNGVLLEARDPEDSNPFILDMERDMKLTIHPIAPGVALKLPMVGPSVKAGFPSPAQDYMAEELDLTSLLVSHPETTFCVRVSGDSMTEAGILDGDIALVDKSREAADGDVVIAFIDGEFTMKQFRLAEDGSGAWLIPWNDRYERIHVSRTDEFSIWGVVTYVIHSFNTPSVLGDYRPHPAGRDKAL